MFDKLKFGEWLAFGQNSRSWKIQQQKPKIYFNQFNKKPAVQPIEKVVAKQIILPLNQTSKLKAKSQLKIGYKPFANQHISQLVINPQRCLNMVWLVYFCILDWALSWSTLFIQPHLKINVSKMVRKFRLVSNLSLWIVMFCQAGTWKYFTVFHLRLYFELINFTCFWSQIKCILIWLGSSLDLRPVSSLVSLAFP